MKPTPTEQVLLLTRAAQLIDLVIEAKKRNGSKDELTHVSMAQDGVALCNWADAIKNENNLADTSSVN